MVPIQTIFHIIGGWFNYLKTTLPKVSFNIELILCGSGALLLSIWMSHRFISWFRREADASPWKISQTISATGLLLLLFGASIAMTGIIHQSAWLLREDLVTNGRAQQNKDLMHAKQTAHILLKMAEDTGKFPDRLEMILPEIDNDEIVFRKLCYPGGDRLLYFGNEVTPGDPKQILFLSPSPYKSKRKYWLTVYADGSGEINRSDELLNHPVFAGFRESH